MRWPCRTFRSLRAAELARTIASMLRGFTLYCPVCRFTFMITARAAWRCPNDPSHCDYGRYPIDARGLDALRYDQRPALEVRELSR